MVDIVFHKVVSTPKIGSCYYCSDFVRFPEGVQCTECEAILHRACVAVICDEANENEVHTCDPKTKINSEKHSFIFEGHYFAYKNYLTPTICHICENYILVGQKGKSCDYCAMNIHHSCASNVHGICTRQKVKRRRQSVSQRIFGSKDAKSAENSAGYGHDKSKARSRGNSLNSGSNHDVLKEFTIGSGNSSGNSSPTSSRKSSVAENESGSGRSSRKNSVLSRSNSKSKKSTSNGRKSSQANDPMVPDMVPEEPSTDDNSNFLLRSNTSSTTSTDRHELGTEDFYDAIGSCNNNNNNNNNNSDLYDDLGAPAANNLYDDIRGPLANRKFLAGHQPQNNDDNSNRRINNDLDLDNIYDDNQAITNSNNHYTKRNFENDVDNEYVENYPCDDEDDDYSSPITTNSSDHQIQPTNIVSKVIYEDAESSDPFYLESNREAYRERLENQNNPNANGTSTHKKNEDRESKKGNTSTEVVDDQILRDILKKIEEEQTNKGHNLEGSSPALKLTQEDMVPYSQLSSPALNRTNNNDSCISSDVSNCSLENLSHPNLENFSIDESPVHLLAVQTKTMSTCSVKSTGSAASSSSIASNCSSRSDVSKRSSRPQPIIPDPLVIVEKDRKEKTFVYEGDDMPEYSTPFAVPVSPGLISFQKQMEGSYDTVTNSLIADINEDDVDGHDNHTTSERNVPYKEKRPQDEKNDYDSEYQICTFENNESIDRNDNNNGNTNDAQLEMPDFLPTAANNNNSHNGSDGAPKEKSTCDDEKEKDDLDSEYQVYSFENDYDHDSNINNNSNSNNQDNNINHDNDKSNTNLQMPNHLPEMPNFVPVLPSAFPQQSPPSVTAPSDNSMPSTGTRRRSRGYTVSGSGGGGLPSVLPGAPCIQATPLSSVLPDILPTGKTSVSPQSSQPQQRRRSFNQEGVSTMHGKTSVSPQSSQPQQRRRSFVQEGVSSKQRRNSVQGGSLSSSGTMSQQQQLPTNNTAARPTSPNPGRRKYVYQGTTSPSATNPPTGSPAFQFAPAANTTIIVSDLQPPPNIDDFNESAVIADAEFNKARRASVQGPPQRKPPPDLPPSPVLPRSSPALVVKQTSVDAVPSTGESPRPRRQRRYSYSPSSKKPQIPNQQGVNSLPSIDQGSSYGPPQGPPPLPSSPADNYRKSMRRN